MNQQTTASSIAPAIDVIDMSPAPGHGTGFVRVGLTTSPSAPSRARYVLRHLLGEWQQESLSDPALLLVSELVTNAVRASRSRLPADHLDVQAITLSLRITDTSLLIEVWDASPDLPVVRDADLTADSGRGLSLVDVLAEDWGHRPAGGGKVVWCEVAAAA